MSPTTTPPTAALIVVSNRIVDGIKPDHATDTAATLLAGAGISLIHHEVVREEESAIVHALDSQLHTFNETRRGGNVGANKADIVITPAAPGRGPAMWFPK